MPREQPIMKPIPRLYKYQAIDLIMSGFVHGMQTALPALSVEKALQIFVDLYGIDYHEYPLDSAINKYSEIKKERLKL